MKKKFSRIKLVIFIVIICFIVILSFFSFFSFTMPFNNRNSIAEIQRININGWNQWLLIRGKNLENPVLLFLHGGPGDSESLLFKHYQSQLENHFICVYWDQRGAGNSYTANIPKVSLNFNQLVDDARELTEYLKKKFAKEKIFLLGHSFGSVIGAYLAYHYPDNYEAYFGVGQMVDSVLQEKQSYEYTLNRAISDKNEEAKHELIEIGPPKKGKYAKPMDIFIQRKWLRYYNGIRLNNKDFDTYNGIVSFSPEYTIIDKINLLSTSTKIFPLMIEDFTSVDLTEMTEYSIPIYLCLGRNDFNTPSEIAVKYFNTLAAPNKELKFFEKSSHAPCFEEPKLFNDFVIKKVLADK